MENSPQVQKIHRPSYGVNGTAIKLRANYFELLFPRELTLYRYHVQITPISQDAKVKLIKIYFNSCWESVATDGQETIISKDLLPHDTYVLQYERSMLPMSELLIQLGNHWNLSCDTFSRTREYIHAFNIILSHFPKFSPDILSLPQSTHYPLRTGSTRLGTGFQLLRGLFFTVREAQNRILCNVRVKHTLGSERTSLALIMKMFMHKNGPKIAELETLVRGLRVELTHLPNFRHGRTRPRVRTIAGLAMSSDGKDLVHRPIVPCYGAGPQEIMFYREPRTVDRKAGCCTGPMVKRTKETTSQGMITVLEYFREVYKVEINDISIPVVNVGSTSDPVYLPPQVCDILPNQLKRMVPTTLEANKSITVRSNYIYYDDCALRRQLLDVLGIGNIHGGSSMAKFGLAVSPEMVAVPARVLDPPAVVYRHGRKPNIRSGGWSCRGMMVSRSPQALKWTYLWIKGDPQINQVTLDPQILRSAVRKFERKLMDLGIDNSLQWPGISIPIQDSLEGNEGRSGQLSTALDRISRLVDEHPSFLLLIILPKFDEQLYNCIKYYCDIQKGIQNVCVIRDKFIKGNEQYLSNLALKSNLKLGGWNQELNISPLDIVGSGTMIVGIDVTHPASGPLSPDTPSIAAMVASVDPFLGQWPGSICLQATHQEIVTHIGELLLSRLRVWRSANNGNLPENILIYRDAVSDSQHQSVLRVELSGIQKACLGIYTESIRQKGQIKEPSITIVLVGKRHNTRFIANETGTRRHPGHQKGLTPENGTVVDQEVTDSKAWDFYLQSHSAPLGPPRPTHYTVLFDQIFRSTQQEKLHKDYINPADAIQKLTYDICYLIGRTTKAARLCPPVFYADLLCSRARCYLAKCNATTGIESTKAFKSLCFSTEDFNPHKNVRDTMFYT
ncbi:RNA interference and gene silencing protein [Aspergillus ambiguus]|uniref:argonaute/piwi family protein n=1 Tax=Aspergillus ambiguus TaxID=176160 RepID=UPI003CCDAA96